MKTLETFSKCSLYIPFQSILLLSCRRLFNFVISSLTFFLKLEWVKQHSGLYLTFLYSLLCRCLGVFKTDEKYGMKRQNLKILSNANTKTLPLSMLLFLAWKISLVLLIRSIKCWGMHVYRLCLQGGWWFWLWLFYTKHCIHVTPLSCALISGFWLWKPHQRLH